MPAVFLKIFFRSCFDQKQNSLLALKSSLGVKVQCEKKKQIGTSCHNWALVQENPLSSVGIRVLMLDSES